MCLPCATFGAGPGSATATLRDYFILQIQPVGYMRLYARAYAAWPMHSLPAHEFTVVQQASKWTTLVKGSYEN
jgi:hypothetical protein